jgi:hypothetical protein
MENVLKHIVDNPDAQKLVFRKYSREGRILAIVYCLIIGNKRRV